jgi:hypothetical protein
MDKNELRQRLEQVAELKDIKPPRTANYRPAIEYITEVDELGEEYQVPVEITENPTLGFQLVKLKDQHRVCELGCGEIVTNQVIEKRYGQTPKSHWKTRCKNCDCYLTPDGLGFIKGGHQIQHAYMKYFNMVNGKSKSKIETLPKETPRITETNEYTETTTNDSVIRRYK